MHWNTNVMWKKCWKMLDSLDLSPWWHPGTSIALGAPGFKSRSLGSFARCFGWGVKKIYYVFLRIMCCWKYHSIFLTCLIPRRHRLALTGNLSRGATLGGHRVNHFGDPQIADIYIYIDRMILSYRCVCYIYLYASIHNYMYIYIDIHWYVLYIILFVYTVAFK